MKCNCYCLMQPCLTKNIQCQVLGKKKGTEEKFGGCVCVCVGGGGGVKVTKP